MSSEQLEGNNVEKLDDSKGSPDPMPYELTGIKLFFIILGLGLSIFIMSLDSSIIATAIPIITTQFHSTQDIAWYGSSYAFALCALQPLIGKIYTHFAMKPTYLVFMTLFMGGSLICALAINSVMLIMGRTIAGIGAAGCTAGAWVILAVAVPIEKRPLYVGILQSTFGFASILGPVIGGALTQHATWRVCFWINLPVGAATIAVIAFLFKPPLSSQKSQSVLQRLAALDGIGFLLFVPSTIMLLLALQWGGNEYAWKSATIIGLIVGAILLGIIFVFWQSWKGSEAMIPPSIFTKRTVMFSCLVEFFAMGAVFTSIYYLPVWFQVVKDASPTKSGVMYLPLSIADIIAALSTGIILKIVGYPTPFIYLGTALMSVGTGLMTTFSPTSGAQYWIPYQILQGLGAGMTLSMPYVATQALLKPEEIPIASSLLLCFQFLGSSIFLSVAQAIFSNKLTSSLMNAGIDAESIQSILEAGAADVRNATNIENLTPVVGSYNTAVTNTFYVATVAAAISCLFALCLPWRNIKAKF